MSGSFYVDIFGYSLWMPPPWTLTAAVLLWVLICSWFIKPWQPPVAFVVKHPTRCGASNRGKIPRRRVRSGWMPMTPRL